MHQCPTCGKELEDSVRFCPDDGTPLTDTAAAAGTRTPTGKRPASRELQLPVVVGQRYRLVELRGGGGMAKVYRGIDLTLEREVAVKLINPELRAEAEFDARFQREARIASQLADPHIVVVHDFGIDPEHGPFLVMEYLRGQSLRERLQSEGPLPLKAVLQLAGQLLLALIHAHDKGIVHRDIKPDNVFLLSQSGVRLHVRVLDFGIARIYRQDGPGSAETLTQPGAVLGTPRYMSPEQLAGQPIDARSDLYSAAVVIHEALTGQLPYVGGKKLSELCPEVPPALQELLDHCLRPNPRERPQSALEVYMRLNELGKASGVILLPPGALERLVASRQAEQPTVEYVPQSQVMFPSRRRWLIGAATAALVAVVPLAGWGLWVLLRKPAAPPAEESLLGIKIGDSRDVVIARMGLPEEEHHGDPNPPAAGQVGARTVMGGSLGHVLTPADLGGEANLSRIEVLSWSDRHVSVVLLQGIVRAVVVRAPHPGESGRGIKIGHRDAHMKRVYSEEQPQVGTFALPVPTEKTSSRPRGGWGEFYRYDSLGIGFEVEGERVTAITLYPRKEAEGSPSRTGD